MIETPDRWSAVYLRAALCAFASLVTYIACLQAVFFKIDGPFLVLRLQQGDLGHPYNLFYMPLLGGVHAALGPLGASPYLSALVFSAIGVALGVGFVFVAFSRLRVTSKHALRATALVAFSPPVFFFATVVEHHGPFFAFAGLSFLLAVEFERRPSLLRAVVLGLSMLSAYGVHSTGILLPWLWLTAFVARRLQAGGLTRRDLLLAVFAGLISSLALLDVLRVDAGQVLDQGIGQPRGFAYLPQIIWEEWLMPFAPISVLWLLAFRLRELRLEAWAFLLAVVPYLALCVLLIVGEPEFGAYALPLVIPMAAFVVRSLGAGLQWGLVAISVLLSIFHVQAHDDGSSYRAWARGFAVAVADGDRVFLGGTEEISMWLAQLPNRDAHLAPGLAGVRDPEQFPTLLAGFDAGVAFWRSEGKTVWLTSGGRQGLADPDLPFGQVLLDHIKAKYQPELVVEGGFSAWRLR